MTDAPPNIERILVPVDFVDAGDEDQPEGSLSAIVGEHRIVFTPPTLRAVELATSLGRTYEATVRLLHATPPLQTNTVYSGPVSLPSGLIEEINERAGVTSTTAMQQLESHVGEGVALEYVVRPGNPLPVVLEEIARFAPSMVVMAASGRGRVARFFVGSTADRLIREAPCPVMVVPASES